MKESTNVKELYFSKVISLKDDMRIRKFRFTLEDENVKLFQQIRKLQHNRIEIGIKIKKLINRERELLGFKPI